MKYRGVLAIESQCQLCSRLLCYVFCICLLTNKYQKYKSVELGDQLCQLQMFRCGFNLKLRILAKFRIVTSFRFIIPLFAFHHVQLRINVFFILNIPPKFDNNIAFVGQSDPETVGTYMCVYVHIPVSSSHYFYSFYQPRSTQKRPKKCLTLQTKTRIPKLAGKNFRYLTFTLSSNFNLTFSYNVNLTKSFRVFTFTFPTKRFYCCCSSPQ